MIKKDFSSIGLVVRFISRNSWKKEVQTGLIVDYIPASNCLTIRTHEEDIVSSNFDIIEVLETKSPDKKQLKNYISLINQQQELNKKADDIFHKNGMIHLDGIDTDDYEEVMERIGYFALCEQIDEYRENMISSFVTC
jgi:hypothetical protein